jgi:hypothetical protein
MFYYTGIMMTEKTIQGERCVVGFDMDGVIIDHAANKIALAKRYGMSLVFADTHSERLQLLMPRDSYKDFQNELYGTTDFALSAQAMEGAEATLRLLQDRGISFKLISRRRNPEHAIALLTRRGLWGTYFTDKNAFFVATPGEKNVIAVREGVTHFVDDERNVLAAMQDVRTRFLFDTFRQFEDEKEFERVFDWEMLGRALLK